jgi:hypothetical protein
MTSAKKAYKTIEERVIDLERRLNTLEGQDLTPAKPRPRVCVDLDGVLAQYTGPTGPDKIGDPIPGAQEFVRKLLEFASVWVLSSRTAHGTQPTRPDAARQIALWLDRYSFPSGVGVYDGPGKMPAAAYIDDKAVTCCPQRCDWYYDNAAAVAKRLCEEAK